MLNRNCLVSSDSVLTKRANVSRSLICVPLPVQMQVTTYPRTAYCSTDLSPGSRSASGRPSPHRSCCAWSEPLRRTTTWWELSESSWPTAWACPRRRWEPRRENLPSAAEGSLLWVASHWKHRSRSSGDVSHPWSTKAVSTSRFICLKQIKTRVVWILI